MISSAPRKRRRERRFRFRFRLYFFFLEWVNASRFITASTHCGLATLRSHGIHTGVYQTRLHSACIRSPPGALSKTFLLRLRRNRRTCRVRDEELLHWAISSYPSARDRDTSRPLSIYSRKEIPAAGLSCCVWAP